MEHINLLWYDDQLKYLKNQKWKEQQVSHLEELGIAVHLSGTILFLRLDVAGIQNSDSVTQTGNINDPTVLSRFPHHRK